MKEYLVKNIHGEYKLTDHHSGFSVEDLTEIPQGANYAATNGHGIFFSDKNDFIPDLVVWVRESLNDKIATAEVARQKSTSQWDLQVGGDHYKSMKIQPAKFALENKLDYCQANAIKYICRHASKNGKQDLEKAKHYIDLLIEHYYGGDELF